MTDTADILPTVPVAIGDALPSAATAPDVVEVRQWPRRTALILGAVPRRSVLETLRVRGFGTAVAAPDRGAAVAATLGPFTFLVVSPDALATDAAVDLLQKMHRCSPSACLLLDAAPGERTAAVLLRALRAGVSDVVDADDGHSLGAAIDAGLAVAGQHRERVLAIGAHPDDVEIGCAGTLLDHRLRGDRVSILTLSRGAVGGDRERRLREAASSAEAIGAQLLLGDLPDTLVEDGAPTIRLIEQVVAQVDPTVVYVHSQHDDHQDHRAVARAAASATRRVRRVFAYQSPSATNHFRPTSFVGIDAVVQRKVQVLMMFDSQNGRSYLEPELVVAASRYWARHVATEARYAEPFEQLRSAGDLRHAVSPPVADAAAMQPAFDLPAFATVRRFTAPTLVRPA